jgi:hypothetical protein
MLPSLLFGFHGEFTKESQGAAIYTLFTDHLFSMLMSAQIPEEQLRRVMFDGYYNYLFIIDFFKEVGEGSEKYDEICVFT